MSNKKYTYKVVKEDKDDFKLSTIVKENVEVEFRLTDVQRHADELKKQLKEASAERDLRAAEISNIEENHPFVKDFDAKQLHTLNLYIMSKGDHERLVPLTKQIADALDGYEEEQNEIYKQCDFKEPPVKGMTKEQVKQEKQSDEGNPV